MITHKNGFSLVEIMVVVIMGMLLVGGGVLQINNFLVKQKVDDQSSEVASAIRLAKNFATTMQSPEGYSYEVNYVVVEINSDGVIKVSAGNNNLGVGITYLTKKINTNEVTLTTIASGDLVFGVPDGKLKILEGTKAVPRPNDYFVNVLTKSVALTSVSNGITIRSSGVIEGLSKQCGRCSTSFNYQWVEFYANNCSVLNPPAV